MGVGRAVSAQLQGYSGRYVASDDPIGPVRTAEPSVVREEDVPLGEEGPAPGSWFADRLLKSMRPRVVAGINPVVAQEIYGDVSLLVFSTGRIGIAVSDLQARPELLRMLAQQDPQRTTWPTGTGDQAILLEEAELQALAGTENVTDGGIVDLDKMASEASITGDGTLTESSVRDDKDASNG